jgi:hypothetical protein
LSGFSGMLPEYNVVRREKILLIKVTEAKKAPEVILFLEEKN